MDKWIKKMWYIHAMEYYSAIKRNEILVDDTAWMNLACITLNEMSDTNGQTLIPPYEVPRIA